MKNTSKYDEKITGPLFPRLHVNDTEKGGPRAPPRNKMALYEQLSIPSQRFRNSIDSSTNGGAMPSGCTGQENVHDSRVSFSIQAPQLRHTAEKPLKPYPHQDAPVALVDQLKKSDEEDFAVPIYLHSRKDQYAGKKFHSVFTGKLSPSIQVNSHHPMTLQGSSDEHLKEDGIMRVRNNTGRQKPDSVSGHLKNSQTLEVNHTSSSVPQRKDSPDDLQNLDRQYREETACMSIQMIYEDGGDEASETSAVESMSAADVSPDDVVGIIGLKHFWKARNAIVKQQKAFAVQVFELHRLIKVQKLIAASPHILLEDIALIAKTVASSDVKELPLKCIVKAPANISKHRSDAEKINRKRERSAANAGNISLSSMPEGSQPSEYEQFPSKTPLTSTAGEPHMGSWGSYPPQAHQWLIPVMSPTEGLVYKPYSGHGFGAPVHGGHGAPGPGNFQPPGYGVVASHHEYPGMGVPTYVPPAMPFGYYPPYSMPVVNAVGNNHGMDNFTMQGLQCQLSGGGANFSVQHQDFLHLHSQNSGVNSDVLKSIVPIASEVQISTASSLNAQTTELDNTAEGNNPPALSPSSPINDIHSGSPNGDQQARVIRVVPHNRRSATESVARIFRSIQKERKNSTQSRAGAVDIC